MLLDLQRKEKKVTNRHTVLGNGIVSIEILVIKCASAIGC